MDRRLSVRELVAFTLHGADITTGGSLREMREGALGHKARQALLPEGWRAEVPLALELQVDEETRVTLSGRMDAVNLTGPCPVIEEIKLWCGQRPPDEARAEHAAQALCYAHMLLERDNWSRCETRVTYVRVTGEEVAAFPRLLTRSEAAEGFQALWQPYVRRLQLMLRHESERNADLRALAFPYTAFRPGQREMAAQVYTAIRRGRRLLAAMPTGTGKSAAALFPALKALGEGLTGRVYQLTARTTQRQGPLEALRLMRAAQPLRVWTLVLDAKEKQCPRKTLCDPAYCERARGHFLRDAAAIDELLGEKEWTPEVIRAAADRHQLCPFELSLSLCELADVTVCDYNYALDPAVHIQRIFDRESAVTLLIDEAHHLPERLRDMLSGEVNGGDLRRLRTLTGQALGRRHPLYQALTGLLRALEAIPAPEDEREGRLERLPEAIPAAVNTLADALLDLGSEREKLEAGELLGQVTLSLLSLQRVLRREEADYAFLWQGKRDRRLTALCLNVGDYFAQVTERLRGTVCYSATLHPLEGMARLLGCGEEDALFAQPSPFPPQNLLVIRRDIGTRYAQREESLDAVASAIQTMVEARPGRYIAFFPSFAYMEKAAERLRVPFRLQDRRMNEEERRDFLQPYLDKTGDCLALCVLGGLFAEGIDLPGEALHGVAIVGVGLPQVGLEQNTLRDWFQSAYGDGFRYAYQLPGLQKVAQAGGRVIRSEGDRGVVVLLDDRYGQRDYQNLLPPHWQLRWARDDAQLRKNLSAFWNEEVVEC